VTYTLVIIIVKLFFIGARNTPFVTEEFAKAMLFSNYLIKVLIREPDVCRPSHLQIPGGPKMARAA